MNPVRRLMWPAVALLIVLLFNAIFSPGFLEITVRDGHLFGSIVDIFNRAAPVLLLSAGMTVVIATGGIDLSVGAVMAVCGAVVACLIARPDGSVLSQFDIHSSAIVAVLIGLGAGVVCGTFNGVLVSILGLQPIVATLILMVAGRGIAQLLTNGQIVIFQHEGLTSIGSGFTLGVPNPVWIVLLVFCALFALCRGTGLGTLIEAVGDNETAAKYSGIRVSRLKRTVYAISGVCAAIAGIIVTADIKAADANNAGMYLELDAILAVALGGAAFAGGRFSLLGTALGALLMQAITTTVLTRGLSPEFTQILKAIVVVIVCLAQSERVRELRMRRAVGRMS